MRNRIVDIRFMSCDTSDQCCGSDTSSRSISASPDAKCIAAVENSDVEEVTQEN